MDKNEIKIGMAYGIRWLIAPRKESHPTSPFIFIFFDYTDFSLYCSGREIDKIASSHS